MKSAGRHREELVPFVLCFQKPQDEAQMVAGIETAKALRAAYNPETQTSEMPAWAGTSATYCGTGTGYLPFSDNDDKRDDY